MNGDLHNIIYNFAATITAVLTFLDIFWNTVLFQHPSNFMIGLFPEICLNNVKFGISDP